MKNSIKWLTLLMAIGVLALYIFVYVSPEEDNCVHGDYWLTSLEEDGKNYIFSCKTDKGEYHMYSQAKKTYDYLLIKLAKNNFRNQKAILFDINDTRDKFGCILILWDGLNSKNFNEKPRG